MADEILGSQIAYYRAHAPKYDDWWFGRGRHDLGPEQRDSWGPRSRPFVARGSPCSSGRCARVRWRDWKLDAGASGPGQSVTVVDASPEAVDIARSKVSGSVGWQVTDVFEFHPERTYDVVFFSFWLSHVPIERFASFWGLVEQCVGPGGRVIFMDNAHPERTSRAAPQFFGSSWSTEGTTVRGIDSVTDLDTGIARRTAADGRSYELVKIWWDPDELHDRLADLGWDIQVSATEWAFIFGFGSRSAD